MGGFFKWILCLFSPVPIKCIRHQVALVNEVYFRSKNYTQFWLNIACDFQVTGGANGLGRAICFELAKKGCHVVIADADIIGAKQTSEELKNLNIKSEAYHVSHHRRMFAFVNTEFRKYIYLFDRLMYQTMSKFNNCAKTLNEILAPSIYW